MKPDQLRNLLTELETRVGRAERSYAQTGHIAQPLGAVKADIRRHLSVTYDTASPMQGTCAFHAGSGTLAGFQAVVKVTVDDKQIYHWDGGYLLGAAK